MAWLKNFKTKLPIPASLIKWNSSDEDERSVADVVDSKLNATDLLEKVYPVGSIYMSANGVNPQYLFGGTWTPIKDRFLLGAGDTYAVNATGGEATHKLTVNEMPNHNHLTSETGKAMNFSSGEGYTVAVANTYGNTNNYVTGKSGGGAAHNNMPPYIVVYIWKRVS